MRIAVDSERRVVSIVSTGAPVPVEHRELQPPDYETTSNTIFWTRPDSVGPAPFVTRDDPTVPAGASPATVPPRAPAQGARRGRCTREDPERSGGG